MINELKVFYKGDKGLMTFNNKKTIFQHREEREGVKEGLGIVIENSLFDKGNYAFAVFKNVPTVIPTGYDSISFFNNRGVPLKVEKGNYGDNVLMKETYKDRTYIRAYKEDGTIGLYESEIIKNADYEGPNIYFNRLNDLVERWVDITDLTVNFIVDSIHSLKCEVSLDDDVVLNALRSLVQNQIFVLESGVIVADGKFESLIIWTENSEVKMAWLGRKLELESFNFENRTSDFLKLVSK